MTTRLPFEEIVDRCVEDVVSGRLSVEDAIARFPDVAARLRPVLETVRAFDAAPAIMPRPVDPARRAAFMAALRETPQQSRRRFRLPALRLPGLPAGGLRLRMAAVPVAAAAVALVALLFTYAQPGSSAAAATLTVFQGTVERASGDTWVPLTDGARLVEGTQLRTAADAYALMTFADGSTASLAPGTEVTLSRLRYRDTRQVEIEQASGRLWNDVVPDGRLDAYYLVRTADATVHVTGTVFETTVDSGETSVVTVAGQVEVSAGAARVAVQPGEVVRARAQVIAETRAAEQAPTAVTIDAPLAAAIVSERGQATGVRADGVAFHQIAGVATTDPGTGLQRFDFTQMEPGTYTLFLERVADGEGVVILRTEAGERRVVVEADSKGASVVVEVERRDGVSKIVEVVRSAVAAEVDPAPVRVADSERTRTAVPLGLRIAEAAQERARQRQEERNTPTPTPGRTPTPTPTRTPAPTRTPEATRTPIATRTPEPTRVPSTFDVDSALRRLIEVARAGDRDAFDRALGVALDEAATAGTPILQALLEAMAAADLRSLLGDGDDVTDLERAVETLPEAERERLNEILPPLIPGFGSGDSSEEPGLLPRLPAEEDGGLGGLVPSIGLGSAEMRQSGGWK
jgi:ferric-dicitrate binding protein FerR (iron transport regulator)